MLPSQILVLSFVLSLLLPLATPTLPVTAHFARPRDIKSIWLLFDSTTTRCPNNITHKARPTLTAEGTLVIRHNSIIQDNQNCIMPGDDHVLTFRPRSELDDDLQPPPTSPKLPEETIRQLTGDTVARKALEAGDRAGEDYLLGYEVRVRQCGGVASFEDGTVVFVFRPFTDRLNMEGLQKLRRRTKWMVVAPREGGLCAYKSDISGPDDGGSGEECECFPGDAKVLTRPRGWVKISDVGVGEYVAGGMGSWTKVIGFSHRLEYVKAKMVQVWTSSGERVTASEGHYLYTSRGLTAAGRVNVGDLIRIANGTMSRVSRVRRVTGTGLFNVQTISGDVVVDGVWASTYTTAVRKEVAHAALAPLRLITRFIERDFVFSAVEGAGLRWLATMRYIS